MILKQNELIVVFEEKKDSKTMRRRYRRVLSFSPLVVKQHFYLVEGEEHAEPNLLEQYSLHQYFSIRSSYFEIPSRCDSAGTHCCGVQARMLLPALVGGFYPRPTRRMFICTLGRVDS